MMKVNRGGFDNGQREPGLQDVSSRKRLAEHRSEAFEHAAHQALDHPSVR
jgi:hypothetical protein